VPTTTTTLTDRLVLAAPTQADLPALHALHADPAVWEHLPSGRHTDVAMTRSMLDRAEAGWRAHGLDIWTVRRRDDPEGVLVGVGGCSIRAGVAWNVYYRLARDAWGHGYAQELVAAGRAAAARLRPELPVVAYLLEHNEGSRRAAERAGFQLVWRGPDAGNPDPAAVRLVYADRPLSPEALRVYRELT